MKKIKVSLLCISFLGLAFSSVVFGKEAEQTDLSYKTYFTEVSLSEDIEFIEDGEVMGAQKSELTQSGKDESYGISLKVYRQNVGLPWGSKKKLVAVKGAWKALRPEITLSNPRVSYGCSDDAVIQRGEREPQGNSFAYYTNFNEAANVGAKNFFSGVRVTLKVTNEITGESYDDVIQVNERNQNVLNRIF